MARFTRWIAAVVELVLLPFVSLALISWWAVGDRFSTSEPYAK